MTPIRTYRCVLCGAILHRAPSKLLHIAHRPDGLQTDPLPCAHLTQQHEAGHAGAPPGSLLIHCATIHTLYRPRTSMQLVTQNACACGWSAPLCLFGAYTHPLHDNPFPQPNLSPSEPT
eukprot:scaffold9034_cov82-Phaeocystis_antarctica.AAC.2